MRKAACEDGSFLTYLFIVTNERVLKIDAEDGAKSMELEIQKATQVVFNNYLGNSELIIVDGKVSVTRFSRDKIGEFRHAAGVINARASPSLLRTHRPYSHTAKSDYSPNNHLCVKHCLEYFKTIRFHC